MNRKTDAVPACENTSGTWGVDAVGGALAND